MHLWDTASARGVGQFRGHNGSVKSVCPHASNPNVFASGDFPFAFAWGHSFSHISPMFTSCGNNNFHSFAF